MEVFPGHIACDSESASEIVVPVVSDRKVSASLVVYLWCFMFLGCCCGDGMGIGIVLMGGGGGQVVAIIDVDCAVKRGFDKGDQAGLERVAELLAGACDW